MISPIVIPEQPRVLITQQGFVLTIDLLQNAIKEISHPENKDWHVHEKRILHEARKTYPGIEIWKNWTVTFSSSSGNEETINVKACRSDIDDMFQNVLSVQEA